LPKLLKSVNVFVLFGEVVAEKISSVTIGLIVLGVVASLGIVALVILNKKETVSSTGMSTMVNAQNTPVLHEINQSILQPVPEGEYVEENINVTDIVYSLIDEQAGGLNWTSFSLTNNGPGAVYMRINNGKQPVSPLPAGQSITIDFHKKGVINSLYLNCNIGETANVTIRAVK